MKDNNLYGYYKVGSNLIRATYDEEDIDHIDETSKFDIEQQKFVINNSYITIVEQSDSSAKRLDDKEGYSKLNSEKAIIAKFYEDLEESNKKNLNQTSDKKKNDLSLF